MNHDCKNLYHLSGFGLILTGVGTFLAGVFPQIAGILLATEALVGFVLQKSPLPPTIGRNVTSAFSTATMAWLGFLLIYSM